MVFSSLTFLFIFLPINFLFYFISKNNTYRNFVLIIFSLFFYAWGEPIWVSLLIFSATIDFFHGKIIERNRDNWKSKAALISSLIINLSLLGSFKYLGFIISNINFIFSTNLPLREFGLPIGISFYTFQTLSYVIDVYKGEVNAQKSYTKFLLFVSLFHQLVAGPIVRYKDIAKEIENRNITTERFSYGINRFVIGLGKKVLIANTAGEISEFFLKGEFSQLSVLGAWFGIILFAIQIYFDFSGYSDMAIGLGRMFGFTYKENFNYPYISKTASEFWRRWHISLGSFFRDYVYIPLGGNRKHYARNLFIVWFLTGLWHGSSWNFVSWGLFYGVLIFLERKVYGKLLEKIPNVFSHIYFFIIMLSGWVLFYFTDLSNALDYLKIMFGFGEHALASTLFYIKFKNNIIFVILAVLLSTPIINTIKNKLKIYKKDKEYSYLRIAFNVTIIIASTALLVGQTYNPFLYFRF